MSGELRVAGSYQVEGNAGGEILGCEPPRLLVVTRVYGDQASEVELRLDAPEEGGTVLEIEHAGISGDFFEGVGAGWGSALWALELHLRDELPDDLADRWRAGEVPAEVQEFMNPVAATLDQVDRLAAAAGTG